MGTYTTNYNLFMPTIGEQGWGELVNGNFEIIDTTMSGLNARMDTAEMDITSLTTRMGTAETHISAIESVVKNGIVTADAYKVKVASSGILYLGNQTLSYSETLSKSIAVTYPEYVSVSLTIPPSIITKESSQLDFDCNHIHEVLITISGNKPTRNASVYITLDGVTIYENLTNGTQSISYSNVHTLDTSVPHTIEFFVSVVIAGYSLSATVTANIDEIKYYFA